ncbi:unnamed protein product, partial [Owenia fusiformis]
AHHKMTSPAIIETLKSFNLEDKLKFDISKSKYGVCGTLCQQRKCREKEDAFWAVYFISPSQWRNLQNSTRMIDNCLLKKDYSKEFVISNNGQKLIALAESNDNQFVRFIVLGDNGELDSKKSMTISADAWGKLKLHSSSISSLLPEKRYFSDESSRKQNQEKRMSHRYRCISNGKNGQLTGAWYFLRSQAVNNLNKENATNAQIQKQLIEMPSNEDILKQCFLHMLCIRINELSLNRPDCEGCKIDHPSQLQGLRCSRRRCALTNGDIWIWFRWILQHQVNLVRTVLRIAVAMKNQSLFGQQIRLDWLHLYARTVIEIVDRE